MARIQGPVFFACERRGPFLIAVFGKNTCKNLSRTEDIRLYKNKTAAAKRAAGTGISASWRRAGQKCAKRTACRRGRMSLQFCKRRHVSLLEMADEAMQTSKMQGKSTVPCMGKGLCQARWKLQSSQAIFWDLLTSHGDRAILRQSDCIASQPRRERMFQPHLEEPWPEKP